MIEAPVAAAFDPEGRILGVGNARLMRDADGKDQDQPLGRVTCVRRQ